LLVCFVGIKSLETLIVSCLNLTAI